MVTELLLFSLEDMVVSINWVVGVLLVFPPSLLLFVCGKEKENVSDPEGLLVTYMLVLALLLLLGVLPLVEDVELLAL